MGRLGRLEEASSEERAEETCLGEDYAMKEISGRPARGSVDIEGDIRGTPAKEGLVEMVLEFACRGRR